ncbi:NUDIX hydrolase [Periweissella beninensis]|uniref:NUDIX hydrolase n=1 Tax=Periweissella beninensis TaxID=504936 RepID=A0ABT0VFW7_9LACO|nr:NUDIX hydrolase [Periweissella beninensis]MBM7543877.1 ADP-ribose pyrophosphatase YjhB (NUDIX family) [Periweissella beninensis]MCM2436742.1 NUDIX hydrolase [Periweissella beninensis]MCT4395546.1 NUDIX domain-containing protein [Periweissella beninensis]
MADYIKDIRSKVGHMPIILNAVAGAIINQKNQVLLQKRSDTHNWSLPGGYMEYGESFQDTLWREMQEDTGYEVEILTQIGIFEQGFTIYPNGDETQAISIFYLVKPIGSTAITGETDETLALAYFDLDNLPPLFNQQNADMLHALKVYLQK